MEWFTLFCQRVEGERRVNVQDTLVHFHGKRITVENVLDYLKVTGVFSNTVYRLIEMRAIERELQVLGVQITEEELQAHLAAKRRLAGLSGSVEFNNCCHQNGMHWEQWKEAAEAELRRDILRQKVIGSPAIQAYFEKNQEHLKKICIARIVCHTQAVAAQIKESILSGDGDFSSLARQHSLEHNSRIAGGHLGCVGRGILPPEIERDLFSADAGAICGPYLQNGFAAIYYVEEVLHGMLTDASMQQIADRLFSDWLRERVLKAQQEERRQGKHND